MKFFILLSLIILTGCNLEPEKPRGDNLEDWTCSASQLINLKTEYEICKTSGYFDSYCFEQAKKSQCTKKN